MTKGKSSAIPKLASVTCCNPYKQQTTLLAALRSVTGEPACRRALFLLPLGGHEAALGLGRVDDGVDLLVARKPVRLRLVRVHLDRQPRTPSASLVVCAPTDSSCLALHVKLGVPDRMPQIVHPPFLPSTHATNFLALSKEELCVHTLTGVDLHPEHLCNAQKFDPAVANSIAICSAGRAPPRAGSDPPGCAG